MNAKCTFNHYNKYNFFKTQKRLFSVIIVKCIVILNENRFILIAGL